MDVIALTVLVILLLLRLIPFEKAMSGFANPATATVAAMFIISAGLVRTGLVQWLARQLDKISGKSELQLLIAICITIAVLSAFIVNTATVAIFIPIAIVLAKARKISSSRILMPLSFASQFGGVCTLIGTSTNILVNAIAIEKGMQPFGLFEFAPLGLIMTTAGILYFVLFTRWLLPQRDGESQKTDKYLLADYLTEVMVKENSQLVGKRLRDTKLYKYQDVDVIELIREEATIWTPRQIAFQAGDILLLHGNIDKIISIADELKLEIRPGKEINDQDLGSEDVILFESLVPPRSRYLGRTLGVLNFQQKFGAFVLAVQRRGQILRKRISDVNLREGDSLLFLGKKDQMEELMKSSDLIVTQELGELYFRKNKALTALVILMAMILLISFNVLPILIAALTGVVSMLLTRCLTIDEAYQMIDWKVIFLLGGILPLGYAMESSGAAALLADWLVTPVAALGPLAVLAALYLITAVMTETMSNNAAAIILAPIAFSIAGNLGVDPRPFLVAIAFAASTSFATPVGYQTNTMVFAPGGYKFGDYLRLGGPLNIIFWILAVVFIPVFWSF